MKPETLLRNTVAATAIVLAMFSCTKEITPVGLELLPADQLLSLGYTDSTAIVAYSLAEDSVYSGGFTYALAGSMYDPIFGRTDAGFNTQLYIATSRLRFGTSPVFDSAFLYLPFQGSSYGDTLSNMTLRVYKLNEDLYDSVHVYSNQTVSYDAANPLGEITFQPRPNDSSYYGGKTNAPGLRININRHFADVVFAADTTSLNTADGFSRYFKGICVVAEPQQQKGKGSVVVFSVPSDYGRIVMHYHNSEDTLASTFYITTDCARFNTFNHNGHAEALPALKQQLAGDTALGREFLFLQGQAGTQVKLKMPDLKSRFNGKKVLINDAQLVVSNSSPSGTFTHPSSLSLNAVGERGSRNPFSLVDENEGSTYFDGTYNSTAESYRFRLTRYVQQVVSGKLDNSRGLYLSIPSSVSGTRLVLNGTASPRASVRLYLRYTVLP